MGDMEQSSIEGLLFPAMRQEVLSAVEALSDPIYQATEWGRYRDGVERYDDFTINVHILYDDCEVLPVPERAIPGVLRASEAESFRALEMALGPLLADLGDVPDRVYVADPRWAVVIQAARRARTAMHAE